MLYPEYVAGVGQGGDLTAGENGGPGLVVIQYNLLIADLSVTKTENPGPYVPGRALTYTVALTNAGPDGVSGATVADPLPAALSGAPFSWVCTPSSGAICTASGSGDIDDTVTIPAGGQVVYTVTGTVPADVQGTLGNTATVTPPPDRSDPACTPRLLLIGERPGQPYRRLVGGEDRDARPVRVRPRVDLHSRRGQRRSLRRHRHRG